MTARNVADAARADLPDGEPTSIVRRAPFADSPIVGARGQKAQIRILEAALEVFGEVGYHGCGIKRITELSGCSRASFYQYFSDKEDLFRHLAGRVARELNDSAQLLGPITGDRDGWNAFHDWLDRYSEIYDTYEAVFVTFQTAFASDAMVASGASVVSTRAFKDLRSKVVGSPLPPAQIDTIVRTLLQTVANLNRETELLESVAPTTSLNQARVNIAFADAFHRALFGPALGVNVQGTTTRLQPVARSVNASTTPDHDGDPSYGPAAQRTRSQLIEAGHAVFAERGYYATRVSDIVKAAGVSHGVFYRYFTNKTDLFRILAERASGQVAIALDHFPAIFAAEPDDAKTELRAWLRLLANTYAAESSIFTMWSEVISRDDGLGEVSVAIVDASRARLARHLEPRGWGDIDADAMVLIVFLDALVSHRITAPRIEALAVMIERSLLTGPPAPTPKVKPKKTKPKTKPAVRTR